MHFSLKSLAGEHQFWLLCVALVDTWIVIPSFKSHDDSWWSELGFTSHSIVLHEGIGVIQRVNPLHMNGVKPWEVRFHHIFSYCLLGYYQFSDCVRAEPVIYKTLEALSYDVALLRAYVGDRPTWRNPQHPWRTDPKFKLTGVPTLIHWEDDGVKGRLEDHEAHLERKITGLISGEWGPTYLALLNRKHKIRGWSLIERQILIEQNEAGD